MARLVRVDRDELAVRLMEAVLDINRPPGASVMDAINAIDQRDPETLSGFLRAADVAIDFFVECCGGNVTLTRMVIPDENPNRN